ncbi:MAG: HK97 family phage prohead protease [Lutibacter sp.]|nr:HK97 family phage prohead protease [Lutibacter sp.]
MVENKKVFVVAEKKEVNDEERSVVCYASTETVDRHGEMILASAWTEKGMEDYRKNPVILLNHDYYSLPVGKSMWQKVDSKGLIFKIQFADTDTGNELYKLYSTGMMNSFSVGFRALERYDNEKEQKYADKNGKVPHTVYTECELYELSCVTIPANQDANIIRSFKSFIDTDFKSDELIKFAAEIKSSEKYIEITKTIDDEDIKPKIVGKIDPETGEKILIDEDNKEKKTTITIEVDDEVDDIVEDGIDDEYIHMVLIEASLFETESLRSINISEDKGIKAIIGSLIEGGNTRVQKYMFDKGMWDVTKAETWTNEHKDINDADFIVRDDTIDLEEKFGVCDCGDDCEGDCDEFKKIDTLDELSDILKEYIDDQITEKFKLFEEVTDKKEMNELNKTLIDSIDDLKNDINKRLPVPLEEKILELEEVEEKTLEIVEKEVEFNIEDISKTVQKTILDAVEKNKESSTNILKERLMKFKGQIF